MRYLLDTSIYSQPLRRKPAVSALERWRDAGDHQCAVSIVSVGEIEWGLNAENRESRWKKYRTLLENRIAVLPTGNTVWHLWGRLKSRQQRAGKPVADLDLLIAATAIGEGLTVATLNHRDFSKIQGVAWEDWSR